MTIPLERMEYFMTFIATLNVISVIFGYFDGRKEDAWMNIVRSKNKQIENLEFEFNKLKSTNQEINTLNTAFAKMFSDNKNQNNN